MQSRIQWGVHRWVQSGGTGTVVKRKIVSVRDPSFSVRWGYKRETGGIYMAPSLLEMIHQAWRIPGIQPRMVRRQLIQKSAVKPRLKNTETGGKKIATK